MKHTPEPWVNYNAGDEGDTYIGDLAEHVSPIAEKLTEANAARVVQCVNACAGMRHPIKVVAALYGALRWLEHELAVGARMGEDCAKRLVGEALGKGAGVLVLHKERQAMHERIDLSGMLLETLPSHRISVEEYLATISTQCPYCGHRILEGLTRVEIEQGNGEATQRMACLGCYKKWTNRYTLTKQVTE